MQDSDSTVEVLPQKRSQGLCLVVRRAFSDLEQGVINGWLKHLFEPYMVQIGASET